MADTSIYTAHYQFPLPSPGNTLRADVARLALFGVGADNLFHQQAQNIEFLSQELASTGDALQQAQAANGAALNAAKQEFQQGLDQLQVSKMNGNAVIPITQGGTGAQSAPEARMALGLGSAAVAPIVGPVSQSGGVPTGAIIQRGSNANGEFVRYADGTQECWKILTVNTAISNSDGGSLLYSAAIDVGLFPIQFGVNAPAVEVFTLGGAGSFVTATSTSQTPTSWGQVYLASGLSRAATNHFLSCRAKGRWF